MPLYIFQMNTAPSISKLGKALSKQKLRTTRFTPTPPNENSIRICAMPRQSKETYWYVTAAGKETLFSMT